MAQLGGSPSFRCSRQFAVEVEAVMVSGRVLAGTLFVFITVSGVFAAAASAGDLPGLGR
jgi:hypothetical protein